jgi:hypothetical protein
MTFALISPGSSGLSLLFPPGLNPPFSPFAPISPVAGFYISLDETFALISPDPDWLLIRPEIQAADDFRSYFPRPLFERETFPCSH